MKNVMKRMAIALAMIAAFCGLAIFGASEYRLRKTYSVPLADFRASSELPQEENARRARTMMCVGCHHENGNVLFEKPGVARLIAPNLTRVAQNYSDAELERLLRYGVKRDGTGVIAMPSSAYANLADEDVAAIIAWLRDREEKPDAEPSTTTFGPLGRIALALGQIPYDADHIDPDTPRLAQRPDDLGAYLVASTCGHCHKMNEVSEVEGQVVPALAGVIKTYGPDDFTDLLRTGVGIGNRELGLMSAISRTDFAAFTDAEISAIRGYLLALPEQ